MRINHNIQALNAYRNLSQTMNSTSKSLEKLSSGLRINRAADDAAGLAISEKMRSQIRGLDMAERNTLDAISLIQTGEGALSEVHSILQRMRELSVQAANGTLEDQDRQAIQDEVNQLNSEINRIGNSTEFNAKKLLNSQISPEARSVEIGNDFSQNTSTILGSSIILNPKSELVPGEYNVKIEDSYLNTVSNTGTQTGGIQNIKIDENSSTLPEGTYGIKVQEETVKVIENSPESSPIVDDILIAPNAALPNGDVTLEIRRENAIDNFQGNTSGIKGVEITSPNPDLDSADNFKLNIVSSSSNIATGPDLSSTFITNLDIDPNLFQKTGNGYQLKFDETSAGSGKYTVTLMSNDGTTPLSEPVILDNNIQNYDFYNAGSKIGVSFNTVSGVNASLNSASASGKYNSFNINKKIELLDKNNNVVGSTELKDGDPAGKVTITANGIDYEIEHSGFAGTDINKTATFGIKSDLSFSTDGFTSSQSFTAGQKITLNGGIFVDTSSNLSDYNLVNNIVISVGTSNSYTAELVDDVGNPVSGAPKIAVNNNKAYSFGDPFNLSFQTDTLTTGINQFIVGKERQTNATLEINGIEVDRLNDIQANSTLSFHNGDLTMDIQDLTNGGATFSIVGGNIDNSIQFQIGANAGQTLKFGINDMRSQALGLTSEKTDPIQLKDKDGKEVTLTFTGDAQVSNGTKQEYGISLSTTEHAEAAITAFDQAIQKVSSERSKLGAIQNRLEHTTNNLQTANENLTSAESRIRDLDMADEMTKFTRNNILNQAGQAMLAQANQLPQGILQLLK